MSFVYTKALTKIALGDIHFDTDDIRVALVMTNTTADTEEDVEFMDDFGTLDEMDGANYARKALTEAVNEDTTNDRAEFDAADLTWTSLGAGTRSMAGAIVLLHVTNDTDSIPIIYIDSGGFPKAASGGDIGMTFNTEGILQFANAA